MTDGGLRNGAELFAVVLLSREREEAGVGKVRMAVAVSAASCCAGWALHTGIRACTTLTPSDTAESEKEHS